VAKAVKFPMKYIYNITNQT